MLEHCRLWISRNIAGSVFVSFFIDPKIAEGRFKNDCSPAVAENCLFFESELDFCFAPGQSNLILITPGMPSISLLQSLLLVAGFFRWGILSFASISS